MAGDADCVVRVEGVNFESTLYDTHDISTIRGAGLALLALGEAVERGLKKEGATGVKQIYAGASQAAYRFRAAADDLERIRAIVEKELTGTGPKGEPFGHLSFVVDVVAGNGELALSRAEARNHGRQFRQWTVPLPAFSDGAKGFDGFDRMRPATKMVRLPPGKLPNAPEDGAEQWLSPSTSARHTFGRAQRQGFYRSRADAVAQGLTFADSFEEIVGVSPEALPLSLGARMAVFYADGNKFGDVREAIGSEAFATALEPLRNALLAAVLRWYRGHAGVATDKRFVLIDRHGESNLRLETLLWGGDELIFVMPSWLAFAFVEGFFAATRNWRIGGHVLTHTAGLAICHYKTPIRQAREIAKDIADGIKSATRSAAIKPTNAVRSAAIKPTNAVGIEIFESLMPPQDDLAAHRARLYGATTREACDRLALDLALPGDDFAELREHCRTLAGDGSDGLPRSQLYRAIQAARAAPPGLASLDAAGRAKACLQDYETRVRGKTEFAANGFRLPRLEGAKARSLAIELALLAAFWDYADPFADDPLPDFTAGSAP